MSKGTILYIGSFEMPDKSAAAHRVLNNGKIFRDLGYKVVFIGPDKELKYQGFDIIKQRYEYSGMDIWRVPYPKSSKQWLKYLSDIDALKTVCEQYGDVKMIIAYNYNAVCLKRAMNYAKKNGIKIAADCTEWFSTEGKQLFFKIIKGLDSFYRMRILQKKVDGIITIGTYLHDYYKKNKNLIIVPPLVDLKEDKWRFPKEEKSGGETVFVYSGSGSKIKDKTNYVIEALSEVDEKTPVKFKVIGVTKEAYINNYPELKDSIEKLGDKICFYGRVFHEESVKAVGNADYCVFFRPLTRKNKAGFPTKFAESISCGTPVITSEVSDLGEYIKNGENGIFFDIKNPASIKDGIKKIVGNKDIQPPDVDRNLFHYERYIFILSKWLDKVFSTISDL